jgi:hypothetical protein
MLARVSYPASGAMRALVHAVIVAFAVLVSATAAAQSRTDVVTLPNGDHITGEVVRLERGTLEFKTDDAGTLYLKWDKLSNVVSTRVVEVVTSDGRRFLGSLGKAPARSLDVVGAEGTASLPLLDVTLITPIGRSFWRQLDGSVDTGFSYTRSSGVAQLNLNSDTFYRKPAFEGRLAVSFTGTRDDDDDDPNGRGSLEASYLRYSWQHWFVAGALRFETNESLGLKLRSQIGGAVGPRLINSNRAQMSVGGGLVLNDERGVDVAPAQNVEALALFRTSYYVYDRPKTTLDIGLQYYPSLSNTGRHRMQLDVGAKRELLKDFTVSLSLYNTFDNRPPNPAADTNDVGIVTSIGWTY